MGECKSLLSVTVIENIDHRCKFVDCGEFFTHDKIEEHAKVLGQRTVSCPHSDCNVKVGLSKLSGHLYDVWGDCSYRSYKIKTASLVEKVSAVETLNFYSSEMLRKRNSETPYKLDTFTFEDISFCIKVVKRDSLYHFYVVMFATEEECSEYKIEMTVHEHRHDAPSDDSEVSVKFWGKLCSIDLGEKEWHGLKIYEKGMEQIWSKSRTFAFAFSVLFTIGKIPTLLTTM
eukprot:GFUD01115146.1.p1 GENE.GFUD01115146.1~~GFUD01115146.1.p1  ORF type:complete len:246 (+),score=29.01 GFUD01115146.1:49-738(+)